MDFQRRHYRHALTGAMLAIGASTMTSEAFADPRESFCTRQFQFNLGGFTEVHGQTRRGQPCLVNYGRTSDVTNYKLVTRPKNGVLGSAGYVDGIYRTAYRPNPGFVGSDMFEADIEFRSRQNGRLFQTRVRVNLTVSP